MANGGRLAVLLGLAAGSVCGPGCGGGRGEPAPADATPTTIDAAPDAAPDVPLIGDVLTCGVADSVGGMAPGTDLQRHDLDLDVFPDARCNDGTGAVIYFRPYSQALSRNRWVIQLLGGGGCGSAQACANRWCGVDTLFSMTQMTSNEAPAEGTIANGIFTRRADNLLGASNQVLVRYCSSDGWGGTSKDVVLDVLDPVTAEPRQFRMNFLGAEIIDAVIATLRVDGVPGLAFTLDGGRTAMPDLDDATQVVIAGSSAGGTGTIRNVDRIAATLRATNPDVTVRALIDSIFQPDLAAVDYATADACLTSGACDYESLVALFDETTVYASRDEDSCATWHAANEPATAWACGDAGHLIRHHVTTPMFIRQGQRDDLLSTTFIDAGFSIPGYGPADVDGYAMLIRDQLAAMADLPTSAEEGDAIAVAPGGFAPSCPRHETLRSTPDVFDATIDDGGPDLTMFDVIANWTLGDLPSMLITPDGGADVCP